jgi:hypothetical protein
MKFSIGVNDDYSSVRVGELTFYYGYEYPSIIGVEEENPDGSENEDFFGDGFVVIKEGQHEPLFNISTEELEKDKKLWKEFERLEIPEMLKGLIPLYYEKWRESDV